MPVDYELLEPLRLLQFKEEMKIQRALTSGKSQKQDPLNLDYDVVVSLREEIVDQKVWVYFEITLTRKVARNIIENILPPGLLVVVSWVKID